MKNKFRILTVKEILILLISIFVVGWVTLYMEVKPVIFQDVENTQVQQSQIQADRDPTTILLDIKKEELKEDIKPVEEYKEYYTVTGTNFREEPHGKSRIIKIIPSSSVVKAYKIDNEWYKVKFEDIEGFIYYTQLKPYNKDKHINIGLDYIYQDQIRELITLLKLDVDEYFFYGVIYAESRFNNSTYSYAGAQGIIQVMPITWNTFYPAFQVKYPQYAKTLEGNVWNIRDNLTIGIYCIASYAEDAKVTLGTNPHKVLTSYNRGPTGAKYFYNKYGTYNSAYSRQVLSAAEYIRKNKTWKEGI